MKTYFRFVFLLAFSFFSTPLFVSAAWQAYVSNQNSDNVSVIDVATHVLTATVAVGDSPLSLAITPDASETFVVNRGIGNNVSVIDTASNTVIATVAVGTDPKSIAITPNGSEAFVPNNGSATVSVIDVATHTVIATIAVGNGPISVVITPDSSKAFVANSTDNSVSIIDVASHTVIATVVVGNFPQPMVITPDGSQVFVANPGSDNVSVIDVVSDTVIATIIVGDHPFTLAITADSSEFFVGNTSSNNVSVIDVASLTVIATIAVGNTPVDIAITLDQSQAFVVNFSSNNVSVIDVTSHTVIASITVGDTSVAIALTPDDSEAFVVNNVSDNVSVIDVASLTVIATITVGNSPRAVAITPDQAPTASFTVLVAPAGSDSTFDASTSSSPVGSISLYSWDFGDGNTLDTTSAIVLHSYAAAGNYFVTLVVTNSAGTSTTQIFSPSFGFPGPNTNYIAFTHNGGPNAQQVQMIDVPEAPQQQPIVTNLNPKSGPTSGGTIVQIQGLNFTGATEVLFGSTPASSFVVNSDTSITAVAPPHAVGPVHVRVVTPVGTSAITPSDRYTYIAVPPPPPPPLQPLPPRDLRGRQVENEFATQTDLVNILTWKAPKKRPAPVSYRIYRDKELKKLITVISANEPLRFEDHNRQEGRHYRYFVVSVDRAGNVSSPAQVVIQ